MSNPYSHESQFCLRFFCRVMDVVSAQPTSPSARPITLMPSSLFLHILLQVEK